MAQKFARSVRGDITPEGAAQNLAQEMGNTIDLGQRLIM
jgi:hypothetical protein